MPTLRPTEHEDLEPLGELLDDVFRRSRGVTDQTILTDFPLVFARENLRNSRILTEKGTILSHAALWQRTMLVDGAALNAGVIVVVATHPDHRGRGYASRVMDDLQRTLREEDYDLGILWTNAPEFYKKLGWQTTVPRGALATVDFAATAQKPSREIEVALFDPARHLEGVMALHEQEAVRFSRTPDEYRVLLALPKVDVWVALGRGAVVGYLVHGKAVNKRGLIEHGGEFTAVIGLMQHVCTTEPPGAEASWLLFHPRPDLLQWAESMQFPMQPLECSKGIGNEMLYVVHPERVSSHVRKQIFVWGLDHA